MLPYLLLLLLIAWMSLTHMRPQPVLAIPKPRFVWRISSVVLVLMIGYRYEVGGDWGAYLSYVEEMQGEPFGAVFLLDDPAYELLNWLGANVGGGIYLVNLVCAALFTWGLFAFCRSQPRPWLALLVAVPYLVVVVAMGYTRQSVAIGLTMLAITQLQAGSLMRYVLWIALAALFHKSAVLMLAVALFAAARHRLIGFVGTASFATLLFVVLVQEHIEHFVKNYIEAEYASSGAGIRVAMTAIPAAILLAFEKNFVLEHRTRNFWIWMARTAIVFIPLVMLSPSSTAVDRVALYWMPLQLMVLSRLPDALGVTGRRNPYWVSMVMIYSVSVMLVWLFFADHAYAWLPYRFYPWELAWS